jgi:LPXTG-site transpeptidase (sortase) family protein
MANSQLTNAKKGNNIKKRGHKSNQKFTISKNLPLVVLIITLPILLFSKAVSVAQAQSERNITERISVASDGTQGNAGSDKPDISTNSNFIAFISTADNLVLNDTNGKRDVFVHNRITGITEIVSIADVSLGGVQGNDDAYPFHVSLSADGRFVVFGSRASNLVAGDINDYGDVFVHDRNTGNTELVSVASDGTHGNYQSSWGDERGPVISGDGRFVVFLSTATNLVPGVITQQMYLRDLLNKTTEVISLDNNDVPIGSNGQPSISADGRYIVFHQAQEVWVRDRLAGVTELASQAMNGGVGNSNSEKASISGDGRFVTFHSWATNLVNNDTNDTNGQPNIFVRDMQGGSTELISIANNGTQANNGSHYPSISANGRFVIFTSSATNLVIGDTNGVQDVFIHDRQTNITEIVSINKDGGQSNGHSHPMASISGDGRFIAFGSIASNLVFGDTNGVVDIFVHDRTLLSEFNIKSLPASGFTPNIETILPSQPAKKAYTKLSSLWLEIPSQKSQSNIVGVPQSNNEWDVKWLGQDTGWLNGTAFPTWIGNSVITAHATNPNGLPGPFENIKDLKYGDQIIIHFYDEQYIFEVRGKRLVRPETTAYAFEHLEGHSYLTLITCRSYNSATNSYRFRQVVRAVLITIEPE